VLEDVVLASPDPVGMIWRVSQDVTVDVIQALFALPRSPVENAIAAMATAP